MKPDCDLERLEDLVLGTLAPAPLAALHEHLAECTECRAELALLRAERVVIEQRAAALADVPPFESVLARMAEHEPVARAVPTVAMRPAGRLPTPWIIAGAAALALAAALLLDLGRRAPAPAITAVATPAVEPAPVAAEPPAPPARRSRHSALACEPEREPSCGSCDGDGEDAGEP